MISNISGRIKKRAQNSILVDINGISYDVLIPPVILKALDNTLKGDEVVDLVTYHYHQLEPSRSVPILIGFTNEIEKEFFTLFITVSGVGPKAACRALNLPFSTIAEAIDKGDVPLLKTMPGIGEQRAREIVAKLQGKVGKFGLIQDSSTEDTPRIDGDIKEEALKVLLQLQYKKPEARDMIEKAIVRNPKISTCEDVLNEVYRQRNDR